MSRRRSCWVLGRPASRHRWNVVQAKFAARFICNRMRLMKGCQDTRFVIWTIHPNYCYYCLCYKQILFPPNEPLPVQRLKMPICHLTNGKICTKVEIRDRVDWDPLQLLQLTTQQCDQIGRFLAQKLPKHLLLWILFATCGEKMDYFLVHNLATLVTTAVWPDLAKFHHFGKKIHSFAAFGKILDQLWAILSA